MGGGRERQRERVYALRGRTLPSLICVKLISDEANWMPLSFVIGFGKDKGGGTVNLQISVIAPRPNFQIFWKRTFHWRTLHYLTHISRKYTAEANPGISEGGGAVYAPSHIPYVFVMRVKNKILNTVYNVYWLQCKYMPTCIMQSKFTKNKMNVVVWDFGIPTTCSSG